jgi:hypothetical protein
LAHEGMGLEAADMMPSLSKAVLVLHGKSCSVPCVTNDTSLVLVMVFIVKRFTLRRKAYGVLNKNMICIFIVICWLFCPGICHKNWFASGLPTGLSSTPEEKKSALLGKRGARSTPETQFLAYRFLIFCSAHEIR